MFSDLVKAEDSEKKNKKKNKDESGAFSNQGQHSYRYWVSDI